MIELKNLTKKYDRVVLDDINLEFKTNNIYVIKGISGSGKTTLLNIISGVDKDYDGKVLINSVDLKKASRKFLKTYALNIGYMMQKSLLYKKLTIIDNLLMIQKDKKKILELTKIFKVDNLLNKYPSEVSGGELQRISLVRTLLCDSKILILDEATSNLDHENSIIFAEFLKKIDLKDKIIIIATHKDIYDDICNCLINISFGKVDISLSKLNEGQELSLKSEKKNKRTIIKSAIKLRPKQNFIIKGFLIILIAGLLIGLSFTLNYKEAYLKRKLDEMPINILDVSSYYYEEIKNTYKIDYEYKRYTYEEDGFTYNELFPEKDSTFKNSIQGTFPKEDSEILINEEYAKEYGKTINDKLIINQKEYTITGIVKGKDLPMLYNIYDNVYLESRVRSAVFIPYNSIKKFGTLDENTRYISININDLLNLYTKEQLETKTIDMASGVYAMYENRISRLAYDTQRVVKAALIAVVAVTALAFMFLYNEINMELHFRQREFGYLQLFHFSKGDVRSLVILGYLFNTILLILCSLLIYRSSYIY